MPAQPRITVIMPVYNGERFLQAAIESVLGQSRGDFEFLIINDGSTDDSGEIAAAYARADVRIRVISQPNRGLIAALNDGWRRARAPLIARMDADDVCLPERFARQAAFLDAHPEVGVVGGAVRLLDAEGRLSPPVRYPETHAAIRWRLLFDDPIVHPATMFRRALLAEAGGYDPAMRHAEDYDLWWRLSRVTRLHNLPDVVLHLRKHAENVSVRYRSEQIANSRRIGQRAMSEVLGSDVPMPLVEALAQQRYDDAGEGLAALDLLRRLSRAVARVPGTTWGERQFIGEDAVTRMLQVAKYCREASRIAPRLAACLAARPLVTLAALGAWGRRCQRRRGA